MATNLPADQVLFSFSIDPSDSPAVRIVADTLRDLETLLADVEKHIRGTKESEVKWAFIDPPPLDLVASVNGVPKEDLQRIAEEAETGFLRAKTQGAVQWPQSFGPAAKKSITNILKRLNHLESITVRVQDGIPLVIESEEVTRSLVTSAVRKSRRKKLFSSIEGKLDLLSHRGKLQAVIKEHTTGHLIRCYFDETKLEMIKPLFDKRVMVEGMVNYRADGSPASITEIINIRERRVGRPLAEFIGAAPDFTGGEDITDFMARLRGDV